MLVRALKYEDLDELLALYAQLHSTDDPLPEREKVIQIWRSMLENRMLHCLGLELDDRLVSSCTLTITPNLTRGARPYGQIETVVTHADYQRRGLGQARRGESRSYRRIAPTRVGRTAVVGSTSMMTTWNRNPLSRFWR